MLFQMVQMKKDFGHHIYNNVLEDTQLSIKNIFHKPFLFLLYFQVRELIMFVSLNYVKHLK
jgi:hypothetical protein